MGKKTYKVFKCKKCGRYYMSQSEKSPKCAYCRSMSARKVDESKDYKIINREIRKLNAGLGGLEYENGFN